MWSVILQFLAHLQEFACTSLQRLPSAQATWFCQVRVTAQRQQENLRFAVLAITDISA